MARLLETALERPDSGSNEKFVFISDSTIPLKPFSAVHAHLMADGDSDFCLYPSNQWGESRIDGRDLLLLKHHQWMVLNRPHAELFVRRWIPVDSDGVWRVWLGSEEHDFVPPQAFHRPAISNWCTDEWAFIATIFGAIEAEPSTRTLPGFGGGPLHTQGKVSENAQGRCRTFVFWDQRDGPAFADLAKDVHRDPFSQLSCYPRCPSRPASFELLGLSGAKALRRSEFLFARKFGTNVELQNVTRLLLD